MFNPVRSRFSLAVGVLLAVAAMPTAAGPSLEDTLALSMSKGLRDRMFWNLSVVSTKTKTKSEEPRDMFQGGVVSIADLEAMRKDLAVSVGGNPSTGSLASVNPATLSAADKIKYWKAQAYGNTDTPFGAAGVTGIWALDLSLNKAYGYPTDQGYLGTPKGILAKAGDPSATAALSVGYYLNDDQNWAVEALVLGAPLRAKVYGAGVNEVGADNQLVGKELINTKMLPPMVKLGYYFGGRNWVVRPYLGVAAMYAIFFDTKTTGYFDDYQGGKTSVSIKNSFGVGPFVGLESGSVGSGWRVGFSVGKIKLKTEATLVTRNTMIRTGSAVLSDYNQDIQNAVDIGEDAARVANLNAGFTVFQNGFTTELIKDLAAYKKTQGGDGSLGTFVRKQKTELSNTIFMLNVGRSF
ncbi:MAG: OmpW family outer membrane protein [Aquabacterium sp.]|uniref:OmpW/AlkL family protein n=1 Tax=Aquabacterium sp. TaxID=1872578 RepID=UPI002A35C61A|nr:OmpW family outer membrane protein [Aquabacterium sp.]MDX9842851.1 OmpW family outer membrane protein [Aquabacterium sp.]